MIASLLSRNWAKATSAATKLNSGDCVIAPCSDSPPEQNLKQAQVSQLTNFARTNFVTATLLRTL
jgi:hypothetical protein